MGEIACPFCGEDRLIEWCDVLQHYVCVVCARTWLDNTRAPMYVAAPPAPPRAATRATPPTPPRVAHAPVDPGAIRRRLELVIAALDVLARRRDDDRLAEAALEAAIDAQSLLDLLTQEIDRVPLDIDAAKESRAAVYP